MKNERAILKIVADNIRHFRLDANISQEKLAEYADVHRNYIGRVERCEINISLIQLARIAKALKLKPFELLKD